MSLRSLLGIVVSIYSSVAFGQEISWKALDGTHRSVGSIFLTSDSTITNFSYVLPAPDSAWRLAPPHFSPSYPTGSFIVAILGDTAYAALHDTLVVSYDSGHTYKVLGIFASNPTVFVSSLVRTPSGAFVITNSSGGVFVTHDNFHSVDSGSLPEFTGGFPSIKLDGDTLLWTSNFNNVFRSTNSGRNWTEIAHFAKEKVSGQSVSLTNYHGLYFLSQTIHSSFTHKDSNMSLWYSRDRGQTWDTMAMPTSNAVPHDLAILNGTTLFVIFRSGPDTSLYRSEDLGKHWERMLGNVTLHTLLVDRFGLIYLRSKATGLAQRSRDRGRTWETVQTTGMIATTRGLVQIGDTIYQSTKDSLYATGDNGLTWLPRFGGFTGYLGVGYNGRLTINTNAWSSDGGSSWHFNGGSGTPYGPGLLSKNSSLWIFTVAGASPTGKAVAFQSVDSGKNWSTAITLSTDTIRAFIETRDTNLILASRKDLLIGHDTITGFTEVYPEGIFSKVSPTGALAMDSAGIVYTAMQDGSMYRSFDNGVSWVHYPSPSHDSTNIVTAIVCGPPGNLFVVDSNTLTRMNYIMQYHYEDSSWRDVTGGMTRAGYNTQPHISNIYCTADYLWASTSNLSLFRSLDTLPRTRIQSHASVRQRTTADQFSIYPNPASDFVTVNSTPATSWNVQITDEAGRVIAEQMFAPSERTIGTRELADGAYILTLHDAAVSHALRLIVRH